MSYRKRNLRKAIVDHRRQRAVEAYVAQLRANAEKEATVVDMSSDSGNLAEVEGVMEVAE